MISLVNKFPTGPPGPGPLLQENLSARISFDIKQYENTHTAHTQAHRNI